MKDEGRSTRITIAFTHDELAEVDAWMLARKMMRGRSEALRQLIAAGLAASSEPPEPLAKKKPRKA